MLFDYSQAYQDAYSVLRSTVNMQWYVVPLIVLIFWIYSIEIKKRNKNKVLLAICFFCMEFIWEMSNALVAYFSGYSGFWLCSTDTAFMITVGYCIEISFFFAIAPFIIYNFLDGCDKDDEWSIFGIKINNRRVIPLLFGLMCVIVEVLLNFGGLLIWEWWWWSWYFPFLQIFVYSAPMYIVTYFYDKDDTDLLKKATPLIITATIGLFIVFVGLGWI